MATTLRVIGYIWLALAGVAILMGIAGTWMQGGFSAVQELLSPFNVIGWLVIVVTVAPGLGLLKWSEHLAARRQQAAQ